MKFNLKPAPLRTLFLTAVLALVGNGCTTPRSSPSDLAHVRFELSDSAAVRVTEAWLTRESGQVRLRGHVLRQPEAKDTSATHLDVSLLDGAGRTLRTSQERFAPQQIASRRRMPDAAYFSIVLDPLPPELAAIRISAHDGPHP